MANAHYFMIDDLHSFLTHLDQRGYRKVVHEEEGAEWVSYGKTHSGALTKFYSYPTQREVLSPVQIRVTYRLEKEVKPLAKLAHELKLMNESYRKALPVWKTKKVAPRRVRDHRWDQIQRFLKDHGELIECFKYQGDDRLTEGAHTFNMLIASTTKEQKACFEFIKALAEAFAPQGIVRGRRQADGTRQQRNGWIRRYAQMHRKRGWTPLEIAREIQKELRAGTWDERSRLQYNLASNTICKIAGLKLNPAHKGDWN
jgi:hypothetical protein